MDGGEFGSRGGGRVDVGLTGKLVRNSTGGRRMLPCFTRFEILQTHGSVRRPPVEIRTGGAGTELIGKGLGGATK